MGFGLDRVWGWLGFRASVVGFGVFVELRVQRFRFRLHDGSLVNVVKSLAKPLGNRLPKKTSSSKPHAPKPEIGSRQSCTQELILILTALIWEFPKMGDPNMVP